MLTLRDVSFWEVVKAVFSPASLLEIAGEAYLIIGLGVVSFVTVRGMKVRRPPTNGLLWDRKDHGRNTLFFLLAAGKLHILGFVIEVLLWPLWILFLWANQTNDDDETI